jgi:chemotaxis protein MotB
MLRVFLPILALSLLGGCATRGDYMTAKTKIRQQAEVIEAQKGELERLQGEVARTRAVADGQKVELDRLRTEDAAYREARKRLEDRIRQLEKSLEDAGTVGVSVEELPGGGYVFVVTGEILFGSGQDELTEDGQGTLGKIADALEQSEGPVEVVGHTDNVPVGKPETMKRFPRGNLELSLARAIAVADFLIRSGGVSATRVSCVGHGEHRPVADNGTEEGRRKNRRVEIRVPRTE